MRLVRLSLIAISLVLLPTVTLLASPMTITHTGSVSGGFTYTGDGGFEDDSVTWFGESTFTINATADTLNIGNCVISGEPNLDCYYINHDSASITIDALGETFNFVISTRTFVRNDLGFVAFAWGGAGGDDLYQGPNNAEFLTWDMTDSIGDPTPVSGPGSILGWDGSPVETETVRIAFMPGEVSNGTFQAIVTAGGATGGETAGGTAGGTGGGTGGTTGGETGGGGGTSGGTGGGTSGDTGGGTPLPEPTTIVLMAIGLTGLVSLRRR